ncbi:MAG TPA: hypothetical protein VF824_12620 [Thermoanaerobaculia bacterium]
MRRHPSPISIELGGSYFAPYWSTTEQLRVAAVLLVAVVRRLEGCADAVVGARELVNIGPGDIPAIEDLEHMRPFELELISSREIQQAAVLIDGADSGYRLITDGVGGGMLALDIPAERREASLDALLLETARFRAAGHVIRIPGLDR